MGVLLCSLAHLTPIPLTANAVFSSHTLWKRSGGCFAVFIGTQNRGERERMDAMVVGRLQLIISRVGYDHICMVIYICMVLYIFMVFLAWQSPNIWCIYTILANPICIHHT